ncbi:bifunctional adenosylcobinamide kinase/adenosylcobinamide-phosphate guanylyltransferase [Nocardioides bruguierae]|uniref:Adenosylcobinamide kinase n=1 Tax=Nocardioides bruguierae TaxID=2945102 RepID=A0A9X2DB38_9ACTN|nr:bifunctional adenosylcobinamide kinase/adenosylcobinamide-phosphate guanylyltransferase [Nocardioides bruguierae]MCM0621344.1 bifunctional adenosylcobinamide kinase/adenosylcobinamide-phosphate guanylyltransferase [Nocardioides bruguierae]
MSSSNHGARRVLVTGGVRSGKSRHAEELVCGWAGDGPVVYVAPGPTAAEDPDPDWAARLDAHRRRRPSAWTTVETRDLAGVLRGVRGAGEPVLVDCLGTWVTGILDEEQAWDRPPAALLALVEARVDATLAALTATDRPVLLVTNEVGLGVVPEHRSGRVFRDLLGTVNQRLATACEEVHLVVAGRVLVL